MSQSDLAFYTTQELIEELMRRKTFCGVVVHALAEQKQDRWEDERVFRVHLNRNLESGHASRLLERVAEYINVHLSE